MATPIIPKPSAFIGKIQLEQVENRMLFKFTDELQARMEELLAKKKGDRLTLEEIPELEAIGECDRIFTHANALLLTQK